MSMVAGQQAPYESRGWGARACAGLDTELFFGPGDSASGASQHRWERRALMVCRVCPVRAACLEVALEFPAPEQHGVVGGMTAGQRVALLARDGRRPTRSYLDGLSGLPVEQRGKGGEADGLTVTRLMVGEQVPGATRAEAAAAAVMLHRSGYGGPKWIAQRLGEHERQVDRWIKRHKAGEPLVRRGADRTRTVAQPGAAA